MKYKLQFDASLSENTSGACFFIEARDKKHLDQISDWLASVVQDTSKTHIRTFIELDPQIVELDQ